MNSYELFKNVKFVEFNENILNKIVSIIRQIASNTVGDITIRNVLMSQSVSINSQCMQKTLQDASVQNKIADDVVQKADTTTQAMLGLLSGSSSSTTETGVRTTIKNMFTQTNINETINNLKQNQSINITSTVGNVVMENITMDQGMHLAAQTFVDSTQITKALTDVENKLDQTSSSKSVGPFDFIADLFATYGVIFGIVIVIIVLIGAGLMLYKWRSAGSTSATVGDVVKESRETLFAGEKTGGFGQFGCSLM